MGRRIDQVLQVWITEMCDRQPESPKADYNGARVQEELHFVFVFFGKE